MQNYYRIFLLFPPKNGVIMVLQGAPKVPKWSPRTSKQSKCYMSGTFLTRKSNIFTYALRGFGDSFGGCVDAFSQLLI